ncbi:MAG: hypothetical protein IT292_07210 [Deltaproteobacteria bacterium]|nr:hypothetical protein [Deltaproteobacteria bacterium]
MSDDVRKLILVGQEEKQIHDWVSAKKCFEEAYKRVGELEEDVREIWRAVAAYRLAHCCARLGDVERAILLFDKACEFEDLGALPFLYKAALVLRRDGAKGEAFKEALKVAGERVRSADAVVVDKSFDRLNSSEFNMLELLALVCEDFDTANFNTFAPVENLFLGTKSWIVVTSHGAGVPLLLPWKLALAEARALQRRDRRAKLFIHSTNNKVLVGLSELRLSKGLAELLGSILQYQWSNRADVLSAVRNDVTVCPGADSQSMLRLREELKATYSIEAANTDILSTDEGFRFHPNVKIVGLINLPPSRN